MTTDQTDKALRHLSGKLFNRKEMERLIESQRAEIEELEKGKKFAEMQWVENRNLNATIHDLQTENERLKKQIEDSENEAAFWKNSHRIDLQKANERIAAQELALTVAQQVTNEYDKRIKQLESTQAGMMMVPEDVYNSIAHDVALDYMDVYFDPDSREKFLAIDKQEKIG